MLLLLSSKTTDMTKVVYFIFIYLSCIRTNERQIFKWKKSHRRGQICRLKKVTGAMQLFSVV